MTISSEIQYFLIQLKSLDGSNIISYFVDFIKLLCFLIIKPTTYLFSFTWLNDLLYRINTLPGQVGAVNSQSYIGVENLNFFQEHLLNPIIFNPFISGCFNGFFLCLPLTISHLYSLREVAISNSKLGLISFFGTVSGIYSYNLLLNSGNTYFFQQWLKADSLIYIISLTFILLLTYKYNEIPATGINVSGSISFNMTGNWKRHLAIPFLLSWMEQIICFPYLNSILDPINSLTTFSNLSLNTIIYTIGIILGGGCGIVLLSYGFKQVLQFIWNRQRINPRIWRENINSFFSIIILTITFTSIPYYTLDYLTTNSIGLHSQEKLVQNNIQQYRTILKKNPSQFIQLNSMDYQSFDTQQGDIELPIEDLNYRAEKDVVNRTLRQSSMADEKAKNFIRNVFKKLGIQIGTNNEAVKVIPENTAVDDIVNPGIIKVTPNSSIDRRFKKFNKLDSPGSPLSSIVTQYAFVDNSMLLAVEGLSAKIKTRYYDNPIYKTLLKGDINTFLFNQPKEQFTSKTDDTNILKIQRALKSYTNTLRKYKNLPYKDDFYTFFDGSKSFSNKLISHQSKGSLRIVRRLFRVDLTKSIDQEINKILRYDQPLYTNKSVKEANDLITHEELRLSHPNSLELVKWQPIPIYTGWDADSRQYVITNRYTHFVDLPSKTTSNKTFITTFPLQSKSNFLVTKNLNNILSLPNSDPHYKILEQSMQTNLGYQTIPTSASLFQKQEKFLPVDRGIFFWNN